MRIVILIQTRRVILKPVKRVPCNKPPNLRRIVPRIQVIQPGLFIPPVPGITVRVSYVSGGADMVPKRIVLIRRHHSTVHIG